MNTLSQVVDDAEASSGWKAEECLRILGELPAGDLAVERLVGAAQTFALLELSERIGESGSGYNLVQAVLAAGGMQP